MIHSLHPSKAPSPPADTLRLAPRRRRHPDDWSEARALLDGLLAELLRRDASCAQCHIQHDGFVEAGIKIIDDIVPWPPSSRAGAELLAILQEQMEARWYDPCLSREDGFIMRRLGEQMIRFVVVVQCMADEAIGTTTWYVTLAVCREPDAAVRPVSERGAAD